MSKIKFLLFYCLSFFACYSIISPYYEAPIQDMRAVPTEVIDNFKTFVKVETFDIVVIDGKPTFEIYTCNGVIIEDILVTAAHCATDSQLARAFYFKNENNLLVATKESELFELISLTLNSDVALFKVKGSKNKHLTFKNIDPKVNTKIFYFDKNLYLKSSFISRTHVPVLLSTGQHVDGFEFRSQPLYGNSGSPIWTADGSLLGIISGGIFETNVSYFTLIN